MIPASNKENLIDAFKQIYQDDFLRKKLSIKSIEQSKKYSWDNTIFNIFNIIKNIKKTNINFPKLSIITVCYNEEKDIIKTCESVISQKFIDYEWLIIDGGSKDKTLENIKKYQPYITKLISEKDEGIYDAMNKGIKIAKGEYLLFLNSGDSLLNSDILLEVFKTNHSFVDIIYGDCISLQKDGSKIDWIQPQKVNLDFFCGFTGINHQSAFIKKDLFLKYGYYDTSYKSTADSEKWCCFYKNKVVFKKINTYISLVKGFDGMSSLEKNIKIISEERQRIVDKYYVNNKNLKLNLRRQVLIFCKKISPPKLKSYFKKIYFRLGLNRFE
jgi:glycosyltransferase involved in cell wall biosynthesis